MSTPGEEQYTKVSTEAAEDFVQTYYSALQSNKGSIATFYSPAPTTILFNGNVVADGAAVQDIFSNQMPQTRYEVQSFDCQIINRDYRTDVTSITTTKPSLKNMSILLTTSGYVQFGTDRSPPQRGFSETFVLVPAGSASGKGKTRKDWLIQSQNFRIVV